MTEPTAAQQEVNEKSQTAEIGGGAALQPAVPGDPAAGSSCTLKLVADGLRPITVLEQSGVAVGSHPTPPGAFAAGCGWPVAFEWRVPSDLRSAFIIVTVTLDDDAAREAVAAAESGVAGAAGPGEHFFVVRHSPAAGDPAPVVLVLATNTWNSYNCACSPPPPRPPAGPACLILVAADWGGACHYAGRLNDVVPPQQENLLNGSPRLSFQRPMAAGCVSLPADAPRVPNRPEVGGIPQNWRLECKRLQQTPAPVAPLT